MSSCSTTLNRKQPVEKGPFGRPVARRTTSKGQTVTPAPENPQKLQDQKAIDDIFTRFKKDMEEKETRTPREQKPAAAPTSLPHVQSAMDLTRPAPPAPSGVGGFKEPTEVLIYGFGGDYQYAALEFYEGVSGGSIYEDYDRQPAHARYNTLLSTSRPMIPRNIPSSAIRKINDFQGGNHWIKVTFDSPEAADRACYFSPHLVHGFSCYCEPWRGVGPSSDEAIIAGSSSISGPAPESFRQRKPLAGQGKGWNSMPSRIHSAPALTSAALSMDGPSGSSTASSATATGNDKQALQSIPEDSQTAPSTPSHASQQQEQKPLRVRGAMRAVLLPASSALLPVAPWSQRTFGHLPLVGSLFGGDPRLQPGQVGSGGIIGVAVPRKEDGKFDWERASWYWRACWCVDHYAGMDLCGLKGEE